MFDSINGPKYIRPRDEPLLVPPFHLMSADAAAVERLLPAPMPPTAPVTVTSAIAPSAEERSIECTPLNWTRLDCFASGPRATRQAATMALAAARALPVAFRTPTTLMTSRPLLSDRIAHRKTPGMTSCATPVLNS